MAYITRDYLDRFASNLGAQKSQEFRSRPSAINDSQKATYQRTIFLSHSHHDKDLVEKVALFLLSQGSHVYVDWKDSSMPLVTSAVTADRIKARIRLCDEFVVLASNNALDSKWVPWELGFADAAKGTTKVSIFPVADNNGSWKGSEYFNLYQKIELGRKDSSPGTSLVEAVVREPQYDHAATSLKRKLNQNSDSAIYIR